MQRFLMTLLVSVSALSVSGCDSKNFDTTGVASGALSMFQSVSLSDQQLRQMAADSAQQMDTSNQVAPPGSPYDKRLQNLARYVNIPGQRFQFKAYISEEVNAFALPNGEIRVYSGLMDKMNDQELLFILGHEAGHVMHKHSHEEMQLAYATSGVRQIAAAHNSTVGQLAASDVGVLTEKFITAQFSQSQEEQSDDYGAKLLKAYRLDKRVGANALRKLASGESSLIEDMFSSHPDPESRAKRLEAASNT